MIFEYVIVEHPAKKDADKGELEIILKGPKVIPARDLDHARTVALLEFGNEQETILKNQRIEVLVRPFK